MRHKGDAFYMRFCSVTILTKKQSVKLTHIIHVVVKDLLDVSVGSKFVRLLGVVSGP